MEDQRCGSRDPSTDFYAKLDFLTAYGSQGNSFAREHSLYFLRRYGHENN
jgi:hypothetical protein